MATEGVICVGGVDLYLDELRFDPPTMTRTPAGIVHYGRD